MDFSQFDLTDPFVRRALAETLAEDNGLDYQDEYIRKALNDEIAAAAQAKPIDGERNFFGDTVSRLARGGVQLADTAIHAVDTAVGGSETLQGWSDSLDKAKQNVGLLRPDKSEHEDGWLKRSYGQALESAPMSAVPWAGAMAGASIGAVAGPAGAVAGGLIGGTLAMGGLFGLGTYGQRKEEVERELTATRPDLTPDEISKMAHDNAKNHAFAETGGESAGDLASWAILSKVPGGQAIFKGGKAILAELVKPNAFKAIALGIGNSMPFEVGSEVGTAIWQNEADKAIGVEQGTSTDAALAAIGPAMFLSAGMGVAVGGYSANQRRVQYNALNSEDQETRAQAVDQVAGTLAEATDQQTAKKWRDMALGFVQNGQPIPLDINLAELSANEPEVAAPEAQDQPAETILKAESVDEAIQEAETEIAKPGWLAPTAPDLEESAWLQQGVAAKAYNQGRNELGATPVSRAGLLGQAMEPMQVASPILTETQEVEESNVGRGTVSGDSGAPQVQPEQPARVRDTEPVSEDSGRQGDGAGSAGVEQASPLMTAASQHVAETGDMTMGGLAMALDVDIDTAEKLLEQVKATTPLPKGGSGKTVRLYRAESTSPAKQPAEWVAQSDNYKHNVDSSGRWFTDDREEAEWYRKNEYPDDGRIVAVDVPVEEAEQYRVSNMPPMVGGKNSKGNPRAFSRRPEKEFFLPRELADKRTVLEAEAASNNSQQATPISPAGDVQSRPNQQKPPLFALSKYSEAESDEFARAADNGPVDQGRGEEVVDSKDGFTLTLDHAFRKQIITKESTGTKLAIGIDTNGEEYYEAEGNWDDLRAMGFDPESFTMDEAKLQSHFTPSVDNTFTKPTRAADEPARAFLARKREWEKGEVGAARNLETKEIAGMTTDELESEDKRLQTLIAESPHFKGKGRMPTPEEVDRAQDIVSEIFSRRRGKDEIENERWFERKESASAYLERYGYAKQRDGRFAAGKEKPYAEIEDIESFQGGHKVKLTEFSADIEDKLHAAAEANNATYDRAKRLYQEAIARDGIDDANRLLNISVPNAKRKKAASGSQTGENETQAKLPRTDETQAGAGGAGEMKKLVASIKKSDAKLEKLHEGQLNRMKNGGQSRATSTTYAARSGNEAKHRDGEARVLANIARAELRAGRAVPQDVLDILGSKIEYNRSGDYEPIEGVTAPSPGEASNIKATAGGENGETLRRGEEGTADYGTTTNGAGGQKNAARGGAAGPGRAADVDQPQREQWELTAAEWEKAHARDRRIEREAIEKVDRLKRQPRPKSVSANLRYLEKISAAEKVLREASENADRWGGEAVRKEVVRRAYESGKPVPSAILAEFPELSPPAAQPSASEPQRLEIDKAMNDSTFSEDGDESHRAKIARQSAAGKKWAKEMAAAGRVEEVADIAEAHVFGFSEMQDKFVSGVEDGLREHWQEARGEDFNPMALILSGPEKPTERDLERKKGVLARLQANSHAKEIREKITTLEEQIKANEAKIEDWSSRSYKQTGARYENREGGLSSATAANERRRSRVIEGARIAIADANALAAEYRQQLSGVDDKVARVSGEIKVIEKSLAAQPSASKATPEKPAGVATSGQRQEQAAKEPWQMTREEFGKAFKPVRHFQKYDSAQRADLAASHRLSGAARERTGEFFYTHPLESGVAYATAADAKRVVREKLVSQAIAENLPVPASVLADYPELADAKPRKDADMADVAETDFGNMEQPAQPAQAEAASGERGDSFAQENVKKNHYIKRKQPGLGDRKVPWELVSVVSAEGVMVDNKTFVVPFDQITDIRTGMPDLGRGEVIFKDGAPVARKVSAQSPSEKYAETASSEAGESDVSPNEDNGYQKITKAEFEERPDVLFHGTDREIVSFDTEQDMRFGVHFGTMETASSVPESTGKDRSKFRLIPAILDVKNPLRLPDLEFWQPKDIASELDKLGITYKKRAHLGAEYTTHKDLIAAIKKAGYDGVVYDNKFEGGGDSTVIFDDAQILTYERFVGTDGSRKTTIADFGEKIGGARKDVWAKSLDDMQKVDDADVSAQPLSKVWPAPDYQKMLNDGANKPTVALVRALRDSIPNKPKSGWKLNKWTDAVTAARSVAVGLLDGSIDPAKARHAIQVVNASKLGEGILDQAELYELVGHEKSLAGIRIAAAQYSLLNGVEYKPAKELWSVEQQAKSTAFSNWPRQLSIGETRQEAIDKFVAKYNEMEINKPASKQVDFSIYSYRSGKTGFYVGKKIGRNYIDLAGPFDTAKEARKYKSENQEALIGKLAKAKEIPSERRDTNNPRVGEDMRGGQDVTPEMFREAFGFRGVEFGNWVEQKKRQADLNEAYDALMDMAAILEINPKAISLNGELALAFGARGSGGKSAGGNTPAAHYEPGKVVINLTKKRGAGSLGHEWWHALDNYFARMRKAEGDMTEALDVSLVERGSVYEHKGEVRKEMVDAFGGVMKAIRSTAMKARSSKLDNKRSGAYWTTKPEMSARAFESYLISKLHDQGASNDYLANIVDDQTWKAAESLGFELDDSYPYPTAGEMPKIRGAFDHLFQTIEQKETDKGVALFSTTALPPASRADIPGELAAAFGKLRARVLMRKITVLESQEEIKALAAKLSPGGMYSEDGTIIQAFAHNGHVYMAADGVETGHVVKTLKHEFAHIARLGLRGTKPWQALLRSVDERMDEDSATGKALREARKKVPADTDAALIAEETLAYAVELSPEVGLIRRAIAMIKRFLVNMGVSPNIFTVEDLSALAAATLRGQARAVELPTETKEGIPIQYVDKSVLGRAFGLYSGDTILVRNDLPQAVQRFVAAHEEYHSTDKNLGRAHWITSEVKANLFPGIKDPAGLVKTIFASLSRERLGFYAEGLMSGGTAEVKKSVRDLFKPVDTESAAFSDGPVNYDPDQGEAEEVQSGIEGKSVADAVQFIVENAPAEKRIIAERVLARIEEMQRLGVSFTLNIAHRFDRVPQALVGTRGLSYTRPGFKEVEIWLQGADVDGFVGTSYETALHEFVHAVTQAALEIGRQGESNLLPVAKELHNVCGAIADHIRSRKDNLTEYEKDMVGVGTGTNNILQSMDEVLAYGLSSRKFQEYLETIPYKQENMWTRFVAAIRKVLGLEPKGETALTGLLRVGERLFDSKAEWALPDFGGSVINSARGELLNNAAFVRAEADERNPPPLEGTTAEDPYEQAAKIERNKYLALRRSTSATLKSIAGGVDKYLGAISTRLRNISPKLEHKIRQLDFNIGTNHTRDVRAVEPLLKLARQKMSKMDFIIWDLARKNSDVKRIDELVKKYGIRKEYDAYRKVLDRVFKEAQEVGIELGWINEYAPRVIKDPQGFLNELGRGNDWPVLTQKLKEVARRMDITVADMTPEMKADIISNMLFSGYYGMGAPGSTKERSIAMIPPNLNQYYMDSDAALMQYLHSMRKHIEARRFFGKVPQKISEAKRNMHAAMKRLREEEAREIPNQARIEMWRDSIAGYRGVLEKYKNQRDYTDNIAQYVIDLMESEELSPENENVLKDILNARFNEHGTRGVIQAYKNFSYLDTMGSPISAITQIGDLAWSIYANGWTRTLRGISKSALGKAKITKEDVGIERIAQEFADTDTLSKAVAKVFRWIGLEKMDTIGKESFLNGAFDRFVAEAKKDPKALERKLEQTFEEDAALVVDDLQNERSTENVKLLVYSDLLNFQPAAMSEMPEQYLLAGNGRLFYMLKTYTLKQFDVFRREGYNAIRRGTKTEKIDAIRKVAYLAMLLVLANGAADELKDWLLGRKTDLSDRVTDNVLRLFGVSKYMTWKARTEGYGSAIVRQILPPFKFVDSLSKDILSAGDGKGLQTPQSVPVVGKLAYWHLGRGKDAHRDLWEIRFSKERRRLEEIKERVEENPDLASKYRQEMRRLKAFRRAQYRINQMKSASNKLRQTERRTGSDYSARIDAVEQRRIAAIKRFLGAQQ